MNNSKHISEILKDYFQNSNEPLAIEFRKMFAETGNPLLTEKPTDDNSLSEWIDGQIVMQTLHISPRTLQTLRTNGILPFSRIGNKIYYRKQDIINILTNNYKMQKINNYERK